ncbi:MAG: hypothetical protein LBN32_02775 [Helicobacteraceae bacterium]|jgi:hypothetical protein|nr:hypothetical protein [Helicobacteraceae bacterium]
MNEILLVTIVLCVWLIAFGVFTLARDRVRSRHIEVLAKNLKTLKEDNEKFKRETSNRVTDEIESMKKQSVDIIAAQLQSMQAALRDMQIENDTNQLRVDRLEERLREYLSITPTSNLDTTRAVALHKAGLTAAEIAKELRANQSEVIFALRLNELKQ